MKKIMVLLALTVALVTESNANVSFRWLAPAGSAQYWNNYPTMPATYANTPNNWTVLSFVSGDTTVNFDTGSTFQNSYGSGAGSDVFVGAINAAVGGRYSTSAYLVGAAGSGAGSYVGSYAYLVLVAMPYTTFTGTYGGNIANIPAGTLYGVSGVSGQLTQFDPAPPAQPPAAQTFDVGTVRADVALVPEPSSFALLGIGLGLVGLRRFRRK